MILDWATDRAVDRFLDGADNNEIPPAVVDTDTGTGQRVRKKPRHPDFWKNGESVSNPKLSKIANDHRPKGRENRVHDNPR